MSAQKKPAPEISIFTNASWRSRARECEIAARPTRVRTLGRYERTPGGGRRPARPEGPRARYARVVGVGRTRARSARAIAARDRGSRSIESNLTRSIDARARPRARDADARRRCYRRRSIMMTVPRELDALARARERAPARDARLGDGENFPRTESVDGEAIERERSHSFSTQCSSQTTIAELALGRDDDDGVAFDVARDRDARAIDERTDRESRDGMVALARARADAIGPDGADLCADVARELLRRERADHGAFVLDGATAHHAAYRAQLVEWILDVCAGERYGPTTADVAIGYMVRGRCDAMRYATVPRHPAGRSRLGGHFGILIFASTDRDVRTNGEKKKTSETIRNARTRAMGTMAND